MRAPLFANQRDCKMVQNTTLTGVERYFDDSEIIVSKTDLKGRIKYANNVFLKIAGYSEQEILGQPHSIIRHPDMPRCIFKLLWDTLQGGQEIFAYVVNRCKNGDHYWVNAHVTPSFDRGGKIVAYHSTRRVPDRAIVENAIIPLYQALKAEEEKFGNRKEGMLKSGEMVAAHLKQQAVAYDEWIAKLSG